MANLEGGNFNKFTVLKNEDIQKYCSTYEVEMLEQICSSIQSGRITDNRKPNNIYLVINTDEPYADEVIEILKRNGHWG